MIFWHVGLSMLIVWFVMRGNTRVDYRLVALGALLPDVIDKPLGRIFFADTFDTGRLYGHTLLVNVAFFSVLFFMRGPLKRRLTLVPIASLLHLAEDGVWSDPMLFWWPLFGSTFPRAPLTVWITTTHLVQEVVGLVVIAWLLASHRMLHPSGVRTLVRTGMLEQPKGPHG